MSLNVKAVLGAFNQEKALVRAFSMNMNFHVNLRFKLEAAAVSTEAEASSQQPELSANARTEVKGQSSAPATNQRWPRPAPTHWPPPTALQMGSALSSICKIENRISAHKSADML